MSEKKTDLLSEVNKKQNEYYSSSGKNTLLNKSQKFNCAETVSNHFDINDLIKNTVYNIPNTNIIFMDYPLFKLYANPTNFQNIIDHILSLTNYVIQTHGNYENHLNLNTFTISAAERYKHFIELVCKECIRSDTRFSICLTKMNIYNSPNMIEKIANLLNGFIDTRVKSKLNFYNKTVSPALLENFFIINKYFLMS